MNNLRALLFCAALAAGFAATSTAHALDEKQKTEMGKFIRDYLIQNPEVLLEAQDALKAKQQNQRVQKAAKGIADNGMALFSNPTDVVLGNPKGDVTVVEFFDYNCGYCKQALADMEEVLAKDKNIRFVLKEFPILGPDSIEAHRVANAVRLVAPLKYGEFHRELLAQSHASGETAMTVAGDLGIDTASIAKSVKDNPNDKLVQQTYRLADAVAITGTPTYIVGGEALFGAVGAEKILAASANVRSCGKASC